MMLYERLVRTGIKRSDNVRSRAVSKNVHWSVGMRPTTSSRTPSTTQKYNNEDSRALPITPQQSKTKVAKAGAVLARDLCTCEPDRVLGVLGEFYFHLNRTAER